MKKKSTSRTYSVSFEVNQPKKIKKRKRTKKQQTILERFQMLNILKDITQECYDNNMELIQTALDDLRSNCKHRPDALDVTRCEFCWEKL